MRVLVICLCFTLVACRPVVSPADSGPNLLDPAFATGGSTQISFDCSGTARANAVVAVGNGRVVAGGHGCNGWALARVLDTGALDPSYGDGGTVLLFPDSGGFFEVRTLVARPDGQVIARGAANTRDFVRQFSASGSVDESFAAAVDQALAGQLVFIHAIALQPDGKVVIAAGSHVTRVLSDGAIDTSFGSGGAVSVPLFGTDTLLTRMLVRPDGRILLIGFDASDPMEPFVAELSSSGALQTSFGKSGVVKVRPPLGGYVEIRDAALQPDGKLVLAGSIRTTGLAHNRAAVWRLTTLGALDPPFGANGESEAPAGGGNDGFSAVAVLEDGKIVAVGKNQSASLIEEWWRLVRFTPSGELDPTFSTNGTTVFRVGASGPDGASAVAVTPAGYVVAGRAYATTNTATTSFALARILP